jgi:hypothetical protein
MTYPDGIDALVNVNAGDTLAGGGHAARHNSVNTALDEVKDLLNGGDAGQVLIAAGSAAPPVWGTGGKILQIVRATDTTLRSTTSSSFVDVTGMSVTITPQFYTSAVLILASFVSDGTRTSGAGVFSLFRITDSSNNAISGTENSGHGSSVGGATSNFVRDSLVLIAYATPSTTNATTYKLRFARSAVSNSTDILNNETTGQMYAIEVSA